jgi:precorrin-6x reductase
MNERIRELLDRALKEFMDQHEYATVIVPDSLSQKFAELIIRECMRMCDCADVSLLEHNRPQEASGAAGAKEIIKEWFGVEE